MTAKEAIDILWRYDVYFEPHPAEDVMHAIDMAIEALEKQIPTKPMVSIDVDNKNLWHLYCTNCGTWVGMHNKRLKKSDMHNNTNREICAKCGQIFDLGEFYE